MLNECCVAYVLMSDASRNILLLTFTSVASPLKKKTLDQLAGPLSTSLMITKRVDLQPGCKAD